MAAVGAAVSYYLPAVFHHLSKPVPEITTLVVDNSTPPLTMMMPPAATANGSPGPVCTNFRSWGLANGGVDAHQTEFSLIVQGTSSTSDVVIVGMRAQIVSRSAPLGGTVVSCPTAGTIAPVPVKINLDTSGQGQLVRAAPGTPFDKTVSSVEPEDFDVGATASNASYRWDLIVVASVGGQTKTFVVTDHGKPFETTPLPEGATNYSWNFSNAWNPEKDGSTALAPAIPLGTVLRAGTG